ncbi:glucosaminidase domain-containing protein [Polaribacter vadi]|uniref:glucosaminidase domain-containing protein n=1 Tax=Polaribacter vadi TaxID=1774273 RepID=UPI0030EB4721|tara:strand:+ start:7725 stop:8573 length:849 start_codon:yes stop_codon:yes gene_type:complete
MKLKGIVFLCSILFLASCGAKKTVVNKENPGVVIVEPEPVDLPSVNEKEITKKLVKKNPNLNTLTIDYIRKYAPIAVKEMHEYKIPASITLAQGILESGKGRSELALKSNNHFGIKCHTGWTGDSVYHDDDEKGECFRKYVYPETSYNDHSLFLTQRRRYAFLFGYKITDYKRWANGLKKAGYATDPKYPAKLIKIIKDYKLYEFDKISKRAYSKEILALNDGESFEKPTVIQKTEPKFYEVEKGDTLYSIGRKFGVSVPVLKKLNNLKDNTISIGQKLVLN